MSAQFRTLAMFTTKILVYTLARFQQLDSIVEINFAVAPETSFLHCQRESVPPSRANHRAKVT